MLACTNLPNYLSINMQHMNVRRRANTLGEEDSAQQILTTLYQNAATHRNSNNQDILILCHRGCLCSSHVHDTLTF